MASRKSGPLLVAKWFINRVDRDSGDAITHLKLQKLVYYAQAWHLAHYSRELFSEDMEAWTHGPVTPSVWRVFRDYRWDAIPAQSKFAGLDAEKGGFLENVFSVYGSYSAKELEKMTHDEEPWSKTRGNLPLEIKCTRPIDKVLMRDFYAMRINKQWGNYPIQ